MSLLPRDVAALVRRGLPIRATGPGGYVPPERPYIYGASPTRLRPAMAYDYDLLVQQTKEREEDKARRKRLSRRKPRPAYVPPPPPEPPAWEDTVVEATAPDQQVEEFLRKWVDGDSDTLLPPIKVVREFPETPEPPPPPPPKPKRARFTHVSVSPISADDIEALLDDD